MASVGPELNLVRTEVVTVAVTHRGCLRVVPRTDAKAKKQKFAVADGTGLLQVFQSDPKGGDYKVVYKQQSPSGKPVTRLDLDGEKVFAASGDSVRAFTKKGREYFKVETNLAEAIQSMAVRTPWIWTAGDYVVACFEEGTEVAYLNTPDRVNDLVLESPPASADKTVDAIIGCQDRMLRVVRGKEIALREPCEGGVLTVKPYQHTGGKEGQPHREVHYGTDNGMVGACRWGTGGLQKRWVVPNTDKVGGITALHSKDLTGDGMFDILAGRDDGTLEVYGWEVGQQGAPQMVWRSTVNESVQAIDTGAVTQLQQEEALVCTYTGKVLAYAHDTRVEEVPVKVPGAPAPKAVKAQASVAAQERKKRIGLLEEDIEKLKVRLETKREEYQKASGSEEMVAVTVNHNLKSKFVLDASAAWTLTIELDSPIDTIALQSDVDIELLDTDASTCIVSTSKAYESDKKTKLLACYRCTESTTRMEVKVRTVEGQYGTLRAFVIPFLSPKTCQLSTYDIKPLSLHQRLNEPKKLPDEICSIRVEGNFSVTDIHGWIGDCLPEVPVMLHDSSACYFFESTFQGTIIKAQYRAGEGTVWSDNISSLMVIRDYITMAATSRKIEVRVVPDTSNLDASCKRVLQLLHEKLEYQLGLSEKVKLIDALKEIEMQEQDVNFLAQDYRDILGSARSIEREHKLQPRRLEFLYGIVRKLFLDKHKPRGQLPTQKIPLLMQKLQEGYTLSDLQEFFTHN
eukprot:Hpha_TRINITY_DN16881_c2_g18::TRINITY_DN16881_c2_g18_i1::g.149502::m.149502/K16749/BBS7; Bardet-Biedl syndrome 7 protein